MVCLLSIVVLPVKAAVEAADDVGEVVTLAHPARRIVSLAPNVTELLFSAGAGDRVVGAVQYSNYPQAAKSIPRIGNGGELNLERIVALRPDLVVGWASGNSKLAIVRLRDLGFPVYLTQARELQDIARDVVQLGRLAGTESIARRATSAFLRRYEALRSRYTGRPTVRVFYQVLDPELITVNGDHIVSDILRLCGGVNTFASLPVLAPVINEETVLRADPEAIVAGGTRDAWRLWKERWNERTTVTAVKRGAMYLIPADLIHRDTLRVLDGAERVCEALEDARRRRAGESESKAAVR